MQGNEAYVLSKALITSVAAGIENYTISDTGLLEFDTSDGQHLTYQFRQPEDGVSVLEIKIDANNQVIVTYSDGQVESAGTISTVKGDKGDKGANGKSAYDIAVEEGYPGTKEEWIESLKGDDGYSPTINVKESTDDTYILSINTKDTSYDTPNLKGADGGSDAPLTPEQVNTLISLL